MKLDSTAQFVNLAEPFAREHFTSFHGLFLSIGSQARTIFGTQPISLWMYDRPKRVYHQLITQEPSTVPSLISEDSDLGILLGRLIDGNLAGINGSETSVRTVPDPGGLTMSAYVSTAWGSSLFLIFQVTFDAAKPDINVHQILDFIRYARNLAEATEILLQGRLVSRIARLTAESDSWKTFIRAAETLFAEVFSADQCQILPDEEIFYFSEPQPDALIRIMDLADPAEKVAISRSKPVQEGLHSLHGISGGSLLWVPVRAGDKPITDDPVLAAIFLRRANPRQPFLPCDQLLAAFGSLSFLSALQTWRTRAQIGNEIALERSFKTIIEAVYSTDYSEVETESDIPKSDRILREIVEQAVKVFRGHSGSLLLKVPGENKLRVEKEVRYGSRADKDIIVNFDEGLCGYAATHRQTVAAPDVHRDPRYVETLPGIRSEICTPIIIDGDCIGVINIDSKRVGRFRQDDLNTISALETFAKQAAVALTRAKFLSERETFRLQIARTTQLLTASSVASGLAHELKNGLLAIATLAQKLSPDPSFQMSEVNRRRLNDIRTESNKLSNLALRLMDLSRAGEPHKAPAYLNALIAKRISLLEDFVRSKGFKLISKYDPSLDEPAHGVGTRILVDDNQIEQVLTNLILNAVDASQKKGQPIEIETKNVSNESISFLVRDYGVGITPDVKKRIFEMFFSTKPSGFGIGLPVIKILVEEYHNGTIEIETKPGRGTTFEIILPKMMGLSS